MCKIDFEFNIGIIEIQKNYIIIFIHLKFYLKKCFNHN